MNPIKFFAYFLGFGIVCVFLAMILTLLFPSRKIEAHWSAIAEKTGLKFHNEIFSRGKVRARWIDGTIKNKKVYVDKTHFNSPDVSGPTYFIIIVQSNLPKDVFFSTREGDLVTKIERAVFEEKFQIGSATFKERMHSLQGNPSHIETLFTPSVQQKILDYTEKSNIKFELSKGQLQGLMLEKRQSKRVKPEVLAQGVLHTVELAISMEEAFSTIAKGKRSRVEVD